MDLTRLFTAVLFALWFPGAVLAAGCDREQREGVYSWTVKAQTGFLSTASVGIKGGEVTRPASFLDAAEIKAKEALESYLKRRLGSVSREPRELQGVFVLNRCVTNGRAYASVWVSEASVKSSGAVKQALKDSFDENPTPNASMGPSMLDEDFRQFPPGASKVQIE